MGGMAGGMPGALCSALVKDSTHPWDHVPHTEQLPPGYIGDLCRSTQPL